MRKILILALLILLPSLALAQSNPGWVQDFIPSPAQWNSEWSLKADTNGGVVTNLTVTGGTQTGANVSGNNVTSSGGQTAPLSSWLASSNVVIPTGVLATDTATLTAAFATSSTKPVILSPGVYNVCTPLTVPNYGVVKAQQGVAWWYSLLGFNTWAQLPTTRIQCLGTSGFTSGQAFITAGDFSWIEGVAVLGLAASSRGSSAGVNCFNASNSFYVTLKDDYGIRCWDGIYAKTDGSNATHGHIEGLDIFGGYYAGNDNLGIEEPVANGGFMSDFYIGRKVNIADNNSGGMTFNYIGTGQIVGNRIEDNFNGLGTGGVTSRGLDIEGGSGAIMIADNMFDRQGGQNIRINAIDGGQGGITLTGNVSQFPFWKQGNTGVGYHLELAGTIYNLQMAGNEWGVQSGGETTYTNFIYKCTSCTLSGPPSIAEVATTGLLGIYYDTGTSNAMLPYTMVQNVTVGSSAPNLSYIAASTPGLDADWGTAHATLATAAVANPLGTSPRAASMIEDTATFQHYIYPSCCQTTLGTASTYTISGYVKNESGTRNLGILASDSGGFGNYVQDVINPTTGALVQASPNGAGVVVNYTGTDAGNGWFFISLTFALNATATTPQYRLYLYSGTTQSYTGDGTSGLYLWNWQVTAAAQGNAGYARATSAPGNPTGTTSTTGVMMGLAGAITPRMSGNVAFTLTGTIANASAIADGGKVQIRYGTGTAPTNTASLAGTTCGSLLQYVAATTSEQVPFSAACYATGLTVGTAYWIDAGLAAITGGTATITGLNIMAIEQ